MAGSFFSVYRLATALILLCVLQSTALEARDLRLATTTSTDNSGLLRAILPPFERQQGIKVQVISVGTGKALKLAENGDVDVVLVHDRQAEEAFVAAGHGSERHDVMYNDFVLVGPKSDPGRGARRWRRARRTAADRGDAGALRLARRRFREPSAWSAATGGNWPSPPRESHGTSRRVSAWARC
jgi:tungstate transport system substrate-binding protein